jgi:hypothetical protein
MFYHILYNVFILLYEEGIKVQREGVYIHGIRNNLPNFFMPKKNFKKLLKLISDKSINDAKNEIKDYCSKEFNIKITKHEFIPLLNKRTYYPKNAIVILMAIYNILKNKYGSATSNTKRIDILRKGCIQREETYIHFSLGDMPSQIIIHSGSFPTKYFLLISFLSRTLNILSKSTNNALLNEVLQFPFDNFTSKDIN